MSIEKYKENLLRRKLSNQTIFTYTFNLGKVENFIGKPLDNANKEDIERYLNSISNKASNTVSIRLRSLKSYFKWLGKPEIADFPSPRNHNNNLVSSNMLTEEEILNLINACDNLRDKSLISILFDSACRKGEIINLNIEDVVIESERTGYIVVDGISQPKARKKSILEPVNCVKCSTPNDKTNKYCYLCGMPLYQDSQKEFEIQELLKELIKTDPELTKTIAKKIENLKSKRI